MEFSKENQLTELAVSMKSYQDLLDAQKDIFQDQVENLEHIVATQCKLTDINPFSQEMAVGALRVKIGKRPRDLLYPKGVNYMQHVFSIKDTISKSETREISAYLGVTVSQVRDFFTSQRSRVRKIVRLPKEKAIRSSPCDAVHNVIPSTSDSNMLADPVPLDTMAPTNIEEGKQSNDKVMRSESWDAKLNNFEEAVKLFCDNPDNYWKLDTPRPLKMLIASGDVSNERRGALSSHTREHQKVQMVEDPGQRLEVRSPQVAKSTPVTPSRPLSADDIQKAKTHSQFMQIKYGKTSTYSDDQVKPESQKKCISSQAVALPSVSESCARPEVEEWRKLDIAFSSGVNSQETSRLNSEEPLLKKYQKIQIPWRTPPEVKIRDTWFVGSGHNSKEFELQQNRIRREREIIYISIQEIPSDPRDPWDRELDYDDALTPEIPMEQLPDEPP